MYCTKCGRNLNAELIDAHKYDESTGEKLYYRRDYCLNNTKILGIFNTHTNDFHKSTSMFGSHKALYDKNGEYLRYE